MAHPVDIHVGQKIRQRRWLMGMTQQALAEQVGIKFQQIQKYETGSNRVSSSRLWEIAKTLTVPVAFFFEDYEEDGAKTAETSNGIPHDLMMSKEATELLRAYMLIPENQRRSLLDLARSLSATT